MHSIFWVTSCSKHHAHGVQEIGHVAQHWDTLTYVTNTRRSILPKGAHPWVIFISNITIQTMWLCVFALNHSNHIGCHKGVGDFESAKILSTFDFGKPRWTSLDISCAKLCVMPLTNIDGWVNPTFVVMMHVVWRC
jgi:hypothetical protein